MLTFEEMLTGGHPNSLGATEDVVTLVLEDRDRLAQLYAAWFSDDEVVRLRVASAMKRVAIARPDWVVAIMDDLQTEVAAIDQPSTQWILALVFDLTRDLMTAAQRARALEIMQHNLAEHDDWIVLGNSIKVLASWAVEDLGLAERMQPQLDRLANDPRKSVASNARKAQEALRRRQRWLEENTGPYAGASG